MKKQDPAVAEGARQRKLGQEWLDRIKAAEKVEKTWLDDANIAEQAYTNDNTTSTNGATGRRYDYNILYANVETIVPAIINSPPAPDIRRRFGDNDEAARQVAEIYERAIRVQVDDSRLQTKIEAMAQDGFLAGRGVIRLRFESDIVGGTPSNDDLKELDDAERGTDASDDMDSAYGGEAVPDAVGQDAAPDGADLPGQGQVTAERLENERITFEAVSWRDYRHGPAKRWQDRPWESFRFVITHEECEDKFDRASISPQLSEAERTTPTGADDVTGWEIWNKARREVLFVRDDGVILGKVKDPLGLSGFFCSPAPMQPIEINGRLKPVNPFAIYRALADQLDTITKRIDKILHQLKVKGWYPGDANDLEKMLNAGDNDFIPISDAEKWAGHGGMEGVIAFWPIEKLVIALRELYPARDQTKQAIYEITGISDIVRGASKASETLGAQEIKSQWGSLRIQKMQRMIERTARDLFVMMSEIIPSKFTMATLEQITGISIVPQPGDDEATVANKMAIMDLMKRKASSFYRIDVESDSTVRADLSRQKAEIAEFLKGASAYFASVAPLVQQGAMPADAAVDIFASTARMFNLGKSVEDTLERMVTEAKAKAQQAANAPPQGEQPNPEQMKAEADAARSKQEMDAKAQEFDFKMKTMQADASINSRKLAADAALTELQRDLKGIELEIKDVELQIKRTELATKLAAPKEAENV